MPGSVLVLLFWLAFAGTHLLLSSRPLRGRLIARAGERGFAGLYSLVALATFVPLVVSYWRHRHEGPIVLDAAALPGVATLLLLLAGLGFALVVASFFQPSPTGMAPAARRAHGLLRITRHPLFAGLGLFGLAHALLLGALSDVLFFGGFAVYTLAGAAHQDARKRAAAGGVLRPFYAETSLLPFAAIAAGRTRLVAGELPWLGLGVGVLAAAAIYGLHPWLFGAASP